MSLYQYKCRECREVSDLLLHSESASREVVCSRCGSNNLEKLISAPSLVKTSSTTQNLTCCGREDRCDSPPCSTDGSCRRQ